MVMEYNCALKDQSTNTLKSEIALARMQFSEIFQILHELF